MRGFTTPREYDQARELFVSQGYDEGTIGRSLDLDSVLCIPAVSRPHCLRRTAALNPGDVLIRLFLLDEPVPEQAAREALAPMSLEAWLTAGLCKRDTDARISGTTYIAPWRGFLVAGDKPYIDNIRTDASFVPPPGGSTSQVADIMLRSPVRRTLDLCTGTGSLALVAAEYSTEVVATDIEPRALAYARINIGLNGCRQVTLRQGDALNPVDAESFDHVVCNPPFVISPAARLTFRDGSGGGDTFCRTLARRVPDMLVNGGCFQMMANVARRAGQTLQEACEQWFAGTGCDVLVWCDRTQTIRDYAMTWLISTETTDPALVHTMFDAWMEFYEGRDIEAIDYVFVTMRKQAHGKTWIRVENGLRKVTGPCGSDIARTLHARDLLDRMTDRELLEATPMLATQVQIEKHMSMQDGRMIETQNQLRFAGGSRFAISVDTHVIDLLTRCNGKTTILQNLAAMAQETELHENRIQQAVLPLMKQFLLRGILVMP